MRSKKRRDIKEAAIKAFFFTCGILAVLALVGIFLTLLATAVPAFREIRLSEFLGNTRWDPTSPEKAEYGLLSMIVSTLLVTVGSLLLAVPIGIGVAAYLSDVAHWRVREVLKPVVEILAGIPSVVVGFLGIVLFGPFLARFFHTGNGLNALNGSILLAIMALPTIISISEDSLNAVPRTYAEASLALGASRWQTLVRVKLPAALSGIVAATMLGMGRAIGEPKSLGDQFMALPYHLYIMATQHHATLQVRPLAYGTALVLFIMTFAVNLVADVVLRKYQEREQ